VTASVRVYISGPMSLGDRAENVRRGIEAGDFFVDRGVAALVPHFSHHPQARPCEPGTPHYERVVASDLAWVEVADAVLLLEGRSSGAERECAHARRHGVPVFTDRTECLVYLMGLKVLRSFTSRWSHGPSAGAQGDADRTVGGAAGHERGGRGQEAGGSAAGGQVAAGARERPRARRAQVPSRGIRHLGRPPAARSLGRA